MTTLRPSDPLVSGRVLRLGRYSVRVRPKDKGNSVRKEPTNKPRGLLQSLARKLAPALSVLLFCATAHATPQRPETGLPYAPEVTPPQPKASQAELLLGADGQVVSEPAPEPVVKTQTVSLGTERGSIEWTGEISEVHPGTLLSLNWLYRLGAVATGRSWRRCCR